jgi:hypothetical protein
MMISSIKPISKTTTTYVILIEKTRLKKLLEIEKNYIQIIAEGVKNAIKLENKCDGLSLLC